MKTDGLLFLHKKPGLTSHDVVEKIRKLYHMKKVGHTGTLDPQAEGLLVLCLGKATRLQQFLTGMDKKYRGTLYLGLATTTYDAEGEPLGEAKKVEVDLETLNNLTKPYIGETWQTPPPYSAKRYKGKRLYELAREGKPIPDLKKKVTIHSFTFDKVEGNIAHFVIHCGSGTYIRTLAHEIGEALGVGAHLQSLHRTHLGPFTLDQAITVEALAQDETLLHQSPHFVPLEDVRLPFPQLRMDNLQIRKLLRGQSVQHYDLDFSPEKKEGLVQINTAQNRFACVGTYQKVAGNILHIVPKVVLYTMEELSVVK